MAPKKKGGKKGKGKKGKKEVEDPEVALRQAKEFVRAYNSNCAALAIEQIALPLPLNDDKKDPHPLTFGRLVLGPVVGAPWAEAGAPQPGSSSWRPTHLRAICDALVSSSYSKLLNLSVWSAAVKDEGAAVVASFLQSNRSLIVLEMSDCGVGTRGCKAFGEALVKNATLTRLNLDNNCIADEGLAALTANLKLNRTLSSLSLQYCCLGAAAGAAIGAELRNVASLSALELRGNPLSSAGVSAVLEGFLLHPALGYLGLGDTGWGRETEVHAALGRCVQGNLLTHSYDLRGNMSMGDSCAYAYAKLLASTCQHVVEFRIEPQEIDPPLLKQLNDVCAANFKEAKKRKKKGKGKKGKGKNSKKK